jgi:hypothetical protein
MQLFTGEGDERMKVLAAAAAVSTAALAFAGAAASAPQTDASFAQSYAANHVSSVLATTQRVSCYAPEVTYFDFLTAGYPGGGMTRCPGATTGEQTQGFATQDVANPPMLVKDHSESDIRVDPANPLHVIGQSKWFVSAEGYNHLLGFYESWDGGRTFPVQGHVPGYEGWTDNTDPVGAFDPWGNFYSLVLPYQFYYGNGGTHKYDNGSNQINPLLPAEAISLSVHPVASQAQQTSRNWITTHNGKPDVVWPSKNANTGAPDKQWLAIDTNPASPFYGRVYAMWVDYVFNPSIPLYSTAQANPDGTHSDWTPARELPTINGNRFDQYLLPHVAPDGTVYTPVTHNQQQQQYANNDIYLDSSSDGGATWQGPTLIRAGITTPTYQNTTFREGIVDSFAVGPKKVNGHYPLYLTYENGDADGMSRVYVVASFDGGKLWSFTPAQVNDGGGEALQPNVNVAPNGTVTVTFYDRRLACPAQGSADAVAAGLQFDPNLPYGRADYCVNSAIQFYSPTLQPLGQNIRLSPRTWDPQLNAPHTGCIACGGTFIGDYFGVDSNGGFTYTTSVSTANDGSNPSFYQQPCVARLATR